ncbi:MAG TPA: MotA/TolQ/ExbB proton channel family protein [Gallionella sp.]|nr:MotA/TolQ/ExbB proton channel family protein [Gallionella sp.]
MNIFSARRIKLPVLLLLSMIAFTPGLSHAWWNGDWSAREKITINMSQAETKEAVSMAPVLVRLHSGNFDFLNAKDDGGDIRFFLADDKTPVNFHVEKYDPVNEMAFVWLQLPKLDPGKPTVIYMYSGNIKANAAADPANTYDANMAAVFHFAEKSEAPKDSTANNNSTAQFSLKLGDGSLIGGGATFDGQSTMTIAASQSIKSDTSRGMTISAWIKTPDVQKNAVLLKQQDGAKSLELGIEAGKLYASVNGTSTPKVDIATGAWHHVALTAGPALTLYLDGNQVATAAAPLPEMQGDVTVGKGYSGEMDELEISNIARSADWIRVAAKGQGPDSLLLTYGAEETAGGGGSSYFGTILHSVTLDGWVVIGVLMIMAVISWLVMALKAIIVKKAEHSNRTFLADYSKLSISETGKLDANESDEDADISDSPMLAALIGKHDHFQDSPLYHIYHTGVQELKKRFGSADVGLQNLTPQAIGAIKASLDATLVRENQKLNSQMVLLTIAISGGPFLGLLGTVVGVMITFAAIAATGDVNVAAIAPGIAAALVATVAGLGVAIPALFGYNYIGSRIKSITADMHVFSDEFVSRITEAYSR